MPTTSSSIPTKYRTVFIAESEKKGFNSRSLRFSYSLNQNETPGPGSYNVGKGPNSDSVSLSTKGTGGFPSRVSRSSRIRAVRTPAPNSYYIPGSLFSKKDFNKSNSSMFHQPIAIKMEDTKYQTPAPNHYDVSIHFCHTNNKESAHSAFVSGTERGAIQLKTLKGPSPSPALPMPKTPIVPGPGHYDLVDYEGPPKHYISSAAFVSNTSRWAGDVSAVDIPGPGAYRPEVPGKQSFLYNSDKKWVPA